MKLALGTAQFGLEYGIANQAGPVPLDEVKNIIRHAALRGIDTLDTAIAYGESESALGKVGVNGWNVITKLPALPGASVDVASWVKTQIECSLSRLGVSQLHCVLLHRPDDLLNTNGQQLYKALQQLKAEGIARKIGVSIYGPEELDRLTGEMHFDVVQAPLNILDRRLVDSGWARRLKRQEIEVHVRSAFLQGLLLMPPDQRPKKFTRWTAVWSEWSRWLVATGLMPMQACLGYVLSIDEVDKIVVGVDSLKQLKEILDASHSELSSLPDWPQPIDMSLINPGLWSQL